MFSLHPDYAKWLEADQRAFLILYSSLSEKAMTEIPGLITTHEVWQDLEVAYRHDS